MAASLLGVENDTRLPIVAFDQQVTDEEWVNWRQGGPCLGWEAALGPINRGAYNFCTALGVASDQTSLIILT